MSATMSKLLDTVLEDMETGRDSETISNKSRHSKNKPAKSKANGSKTRKKKKHTKVNDEHLSANMTEPKSDTSQSFDHKRVVVDIHVPNQHESVVENGLPNGIECAQSTHLINNHSVEVTGTDNTKLQYDNNESGSKTTTTTMNVNGIIKVNDEENNERKHSTTEYGDYRRNFPRAHSAKSISIRSTFSEPVGKPANTKRKSNSKRPKTATGITKFSKRDLEVFLPRKNFFNSHDKVLRDAGYNVDSNERAKNKPNWRSILRMHTDEELHPERFIQPKDESDAKTRMRHISQDTIEDDHLGQLNENIETSMTIEKDTHAARRRLRTSIRLLGGTDRSEYKPLYEYLKYIHDNPEEYVSLARYSTENTDYKHPSTLVRTARVFSRGHNYDVPRSVSIFTHAINNLKPKSVEPARSDKILVTEGVEQATRAASAEEGKTEIERMKFKTEKWMRGLTTQQLLRAKELALKELGEDDINVTKWWTVFKSCNYLRVPPSMMEIG